MHVSLAAAARAGRVFVAAGSVPVAAWDDVADSVRTAVASFRLAPPKA